MLFFCATEKPGNQQGNYCSSKWGGRTKRMKPSPKRVASQLIPAALLGRLVRPQQTTNLLNASSALLTELARKGSSLRRQGREGKRGLRPHSNYERCSSGRGRKAPTIHESSVFNAYIAKVSGTQNRWWIKAQHFRPRPYKMWYEGIHLVRELGWVYSNL